MEPFDLSLSGRDPLAFRAAIEKYNAESHAWQAEQRAFRNYLHAAVRSALDAGYAGRCLLGMRFPNGSYHAVVVDTGGRVLPDGTFGFPEHDGYWPTVKRAEEKFGSEWHDRDNVRGWLICESNARLE